MQNSFEKDVRQKMEELKLTPSVPVWGRIEVEIRVEKKKRRGIFWLLFAGLLLAGGWWLSQSSNKHFGPVGKQTTDEPKANSTNEGTKQEAPKAKENLIAKEREIAPLKKQMSLAANTVILRQNKDIATLTHHPLPKKANPSQTEKNLVSSGQSSGVRKENAPADLREPQKRQTNDRLQNTTTNPLNTQPAPQSLSSDKIDSAAKKPVANENLSQTADTVLKKKIASTNKWRKEFSFNAGRSNYRQDGRANYFAAANYASSPAQGNGLPVSLSKTTAGLSFSLGFSAAKKLGEQWEITAGIQYTYASSHQKLGDKKATDTLVQFAANSVTANGFYTNTGTKDYTTRFHFVEIPVSVSFTPSLRLPLYVSVGAAYGRLLSTNALTFSSASNLYYRNKANDLRNTLPVFSSVQVELFGKRKVSLRTGPFLQYNLLKLQKEEYNGTPHLFAAGLKTTVVF